MTILKCKNCKSDVTTPLTIKDKKFNIFNENVEFEELDDGSEWKYVRYIAKENVAKLHANTSKIADYNHVVYIMSKNSISKNVEIESFQGCCSYDFAYFKCKCGEVLGFGNDDCWQTQSTSIYKSKVFKGV